MFIWFVMEDNPGSLWQSGIYRDNGAAKRRSRGSESQPGLSRRSTASSR